MTDVAEQRAAYVHLYGVAQSCALIALKRGEDVELATIAGMLHDIYSYARMDALDHAHKGSVLAREILASLRITNDEETRIICDAIHNHSDKEQTHSRFDEVLKDADTFQFWLYNPTDENLAHKTLAQARKDRLAGLKREFGLKSKDQKGLTLRS